jgi:NAD-dependent dihydropyrimidine dehydrogenase PreA subunit
MTTYIITANVVLLTIVFGYFLKKRARTKVINIIDKNCMGCQLCIKKCRHKALEMICDENGRHAMLRYPDKCTACKDCIITCKFNALELVNRNQAK